MKIKEGKIERLQKKYSENLDIIRKFTDNPNASVLVSICKGENRRISNEIEKIVENRNTLIDYFNND